ncbi:MAG TPA: glycoside hydrolase family 97 N-terminal domain-containing protein [Sedimentisphaerales bacterium]|nr:glycoside hydrolase family 97 N-terminal domain-containing protein [Sedimentisphaerales bacterium]
MTFAIRQATLTGTFTALMFAQAACAQTNWTLESPDSRITIRVSPASLGRAELTYSVTYDERAVLSHSPLGIARKDQCFTDNLRFVRAGDIRTIDETYAMMSGKRRTCRNLANEQTLVFQNAGGAKVELIVRAYNDGVAFRYRFPEQSQDKHTVTDESTGFRLPIGVKIWAHPYDKPTKYTPAYETYYVNGVEVGAPSPSESGWAFPLLACTADRSHWILLTEAGLEPSYCGTRLAPSAPNGLYTIRFPDEGEGNFTGQIEPSSTLLRPCPGPRPGESSSSAIPWATSSNPLWSPTCARPRR